MNYLSLLKARRKSAKVPSMEQRQWSAAQQMRIAQGLCVGCGERPSGAHSYLCAECQSGDTIEDIREELRALRNHLLHRKEE
ncbi:MAG: hypothetical protein C4519_05475 [Desulfobacteraceae bacterium]|nr:MAG: hypothetical protein C4519_05475 [Desulfobacteraceae bacterium]